MKTGERLRKLRKEYLKLSSTEFAVPLNVGGPLITAIERGINQLTDRLANDICDKYKVNYQWLVDGEEDAPVFVEEKSSLEEIQKQYDLSDNEMIIVKYYLEHPDLRKYIIEGINELGEKLKKGNN